VRGGGAASEAEVAALLLRARSQYVAGAPEAALDTYRELEALRPGIRELAAAIDRLEQEIAARRVLPRLQTRGEMLAEVDQSWLRPGLFDEQVRELQDEAALAPLLRKLDEIVLPSVSFTRIEIGRVVAALSAASVEFDGGGTHVHRGRR